MKVIIKMVIDCINIHSKRPTKMANKTCFMFIFLGKTDVTTDSTDFTTESTDLLNALLPDLLIFIN